MHLFWVHAKTQGIARSSERPREAVSVGGTGGDRQGFDLQDRRCLLEIGQEAGLLDERAVRGQGLIGKLFHRGLPVGSRRRERLDRGGNRRPDHLLEVPAGDAGVVVSVGEHLALFRHAEPRPQGFRRQRQDAASGRPAAPAQCAAPPVEEDQAHTVLLGDAGEHALGLVQRPAGGEVPPVLGAVRVPDHDDLHVSTAREVPAIRRILQHVLHHPAGMREVLDRFEKRDNVHDGRGARASLGAELHKPEGRENVTEPMGHADDVSAQGLLAHG